MFTGIVQSVGRVIRLEKKSGDIRLYIAGRGFDFSDVSPGDSIAVSGVCLTVLDVDEDHFSADVSTETLSLTTLGKRVQGDLVNLEKALTLSDRLGGHLVSGHVDGVGKVVDILPDARSSRWVFEFPSALARYIAKKGSVTLDGTSLTINQVGDNRFDVNLIPHTIAHTSFSTAQVGDHVNIEVDMLARYVENLLSKATPSSSISYEFLARQGFAS